MPAPPKPGPLGLDRSKPLAEGSAPPDAADRIDTVAIVLGPYRNLTTLTASALALHPQVQVLNHAAFRIWTMPHADFVATPDQAHLHEFIKVALTASTGGRRGQLGGSILMSHAFDDEALQGLYAARYGDRLLKETARVLVWKDSMLVQKKLMQAPGGIDRMIADLPQTRFLLPIRHPLDVAISNIKNHHVLSILDRLETDVQVVLGVMLDVLAWALEQADRWPERFFVFVEDEAPEAMLPRLRDFLGLEPDARWLGDATTAFAVRSKPRDPVQMQGFRAQAQAKLARWPAILGRLLAL